MFKAFLFLLLSSLIWGTTFPFQKMVLFNISPFTYNFIRFAIASILSFFVWKRVEWKYSLILGIFLSLGYITQTWGLKITTASKSGFITSIYVILVPLFSYVLEREKPTKLQILGFVLAPLGFYLISGGIESINFGDILNLICAISFALHVVLITVFSKKVKDSGSLLAVQFLLVSLSNLGLSRFRFDNVNTAVIGVALYTAIFATIFGIYAQTKYQKVVGSNTAALIFAGEPLFSLLFSFWFLNERLNTSQLIGVVLLTFTLIISSISSKEEVGMI